MAERYASSAGAGVKDGLSEATAWDWATMLTDAAGDRINFKGNHILTGNAVFSNPGTTASPLILRGYSSTIGDLAANGRADGNGPLIDTGFPVISGAFGITMPAFSIIECMKIDHALNASSLTLSAYSFAYRCIVTNSNAEGSSARGMNVSIAGSLALDCDSSLTGAAGGAAFYCEAGWLIGCRGDGGPLSGLSCGTNGVAINCTFFSSGGDAVWQGDTSNTFLLYGCTLVDSTSDGVSIVASSTRATAIVNCLITDNSGYGAMTVGGGDAAIFFANNRMDRNSLGDSSGAANWLSACSGYGNQYAAYSAITRANEYVAPDSADYRLRAAAPGKGAGVPAYADIGALQRQEPTLPDTRNVRALVQFGDNGTQYTGTMPGCLVLVST